MSANTKSIDFYEQKLIYQNLKRLRKNVCTTENQSEEKTIGITYMTDRKSKKTYTWKAQMNTALPDRKGIICVLAVCGSEQKKYEISLSQLNPKNATMIEMFAYCSYADYDMRGAQSAFGSFEELKNYLTMAGQQRINLFQKSYEDMITEKRNWETVIQRMRQEYLEAGLYAQYQSCLHLQDVFDVMYEKSGKEDFEEATGESAYWEIVSGKYDKTAEAVMHSIQKEWKKYCID